MKISYLARRVIFSAFIAVALIAFGAAMSAMAALDRYDSLAVEVRSMDLYSAAADVGEEGFILREHEGVVGIFTVDGELLYTEEIWVRTLPERDRVLLGEGIYAADKAELLVILEDYDG